MVSAVIQEMEIHMSQATEGMTVNVRLPKALGLTGEQVRILQQKWQKDLMDAVSASADAHAKVKIPFHIHIEIDIGLGSG